MISSMTGYAARTQEAARASLSIELKSVNSRYLDLAFRLPEELRSLEPLLRERIASRVQRGKVECRMGLAPAPGAAPRIAINQPLLAALAEADRAVRKVLPEARSLDVGDVLRWPGLLGEDASEAEAMRQAALDAFEKTLDEYAASRRREGGKLAAMITERVAIARALVARIQPQLPAAIDAYQAKLATRLREALGTADDDRVRQEIALFGVKVDVAEEMNRLALHLDEVDRVLAGGGSAGKRLDFLMQELHREANTLGSKSVSKELSDAALELKLLIEQMREQVQNIE
jgi:uncharacterized protein (TIGR00255 family)